MGKLPSKSNYKQALEKQITKNSTGHTENLVLALKLKDQMISKKKA